MQAQTDSVINGHHTSISCRRDHLSSCLHPMSSPRFASHWPHPARWLGPRCRWQSPPPAALLTWLDEAGSLTARLQALAQGRLQVQVLDEGWAQPTRDECRQLGLRGGRLAWIREVRLQCDGVAWVQARSVLPRASLVGSGRRLTRLGNRSLGALLFRNPRLQRGDIAIAPLQLHGGTVWARRSALHLHGHPVLVAEAFLPALLQRAGDTHPVTPCPAP